MTENEVKVVELTDEVFVRIQKPSQKQIAAAAEAMKKQYLIGSHWYDLAEAALTAIMERPKPKLRRHIRKKLQK